MSMPSIASAGGGSSPEAPLRHSRSRLLRMQDRRFRHRFPQVPDEERLINYFSCALVSDILLQGHLFITQNHFAFYSNIFGHKTQILIPVSDVLKVTKEKIAKIIPNAVGVVTDKGKFIFGSMLFRDTAFRVIHQTWIHSTDQGLGMPDDSDSEVSPAALLLGPDEDSSMSSGISGNLASDEAAHTAAASPTTCSEAAETPVVDRRMPPAPPHAAAAIPPAASPARDRLQPVVFTQRVNKVIEEFSQLSGTTLLFVVSAILLVLLFLSTTLLLYRIHLLHQKLLIKEGSYTSNISSFEKHTNLLPFDVDSFSKALQERIQNLAEVRLNLQKLVIDESQVPKSPFAPFGM